MRGIITKNILNGQLRRGKNPSLRTVLARVCDPFHDEKRRQMYFNKSIAKIEYNSLNLPKKMQFKPGHIAEYAYDASGVKRKVTNYTAVAGLDVPMEEFSSVSISYASVSDYCGNAVYGGNGGYVSRLYTPEGYACREYVVSGNWIYYYTLKDHLGSVRSEFKGDGTNVGYTHYYPSGIEITDQPSMGTQSLQSQERYNSKEFQSMFGLNMNDYGARFYDGARMQWPTIDPLAEKYPNISPYVYCANNPMRYIDPNGEEVWSTDDPELIKQFFNSLGSGSDTHDFSAWAHESDESFLARYDDETGMLFTSSVSEVNGEITVTGRYFNANLTPVSYSGEGYPGAFVYKYGNETWSFLYSFMYEITPFSDLLGPIDPSRYGPWEVNSLGRITGLAQDLVIGYPPMGGIGGGRGGKFGGKTGRKANPDRVNAWKERETLLREQLRTAKTKAEKDAINKQIQHTITKQKTSEPHGRKGQ